MIGVPCRSARSNFCMNRMKKVEERPWRWSEGTVEALKSLGLPMNKYHDITDLVSYFMHDESLVSVRVFELAISGPWDSLKE